MNDSVLILQEEIPEIIKKKNGRGNQMRCLSMNIIMIHYLMTSGTNFLLNFLLEKKITLYFRCD